MRGTGYTLHCNSWSGNASVRLMHWGFVLSGQYVRVDIMEVAHHFQSLSKLTFEQIVFNMFDGVSGLK